jgi:basic membrane lipoprotein Med (substrate-binding protein (PBP1-ABC) superfamily)
MFAIFKDFLAEPNSNPNRVSRRRFIKYAVAGAVVVTAASVGGYELLTTSSPSAKSTAFKSLNVNAGPAGTTWGQACLAGETVSSKAITARQVIWYNAWNMQPADITSVFDSYANQGLNFIFEGDFTQNITGPWADAHPDIYLLDPSFTDGKGKNSGSYIWDVHIGAFLQGIVGGALTKTNKIGAVFAFQDPYDGQTFNCYTQGAQLVNPNVSTYYAMTGDYHDVSLGFKAATALISAGCDFVVGEGDGMTEGVIKACQAANVWTAGTYFDQHDLAPSVVVTSTIWNAGKVMTDAITAIINGTFNKPHFTYDLKDGTVSLTQFYHPVPSIVSETIQAYTAKNKAGQFSLTTDETWPASAQIH